MSTKPDFEALRAKRNEDVQQSTRELATKLGIPFDRLVSNFNPDKCYCACATHGPCEHTWDGEPYESGDGLEFSTTCSRCGMTAMSHDLRFLP